MTDSPAAKCTQTAVSPLTQREIVELRYPLPVSIDQSLASLLRFSQSSMMTDEPDTSRPSSRLSESWDDIRSEDSPEDDLQSENSIAVSLIRKNREEDVESLDGRNTTSDVADDESDGIPAASQELPPYNEAELGEGHDSSLTTRPSYSQIINFQPTLDSDTDVDMKHTIHVFDNNESNAILRSIKSPGEPSQLFGTIRMTMSKEVLDLDRPFRLLYVGNPSARPHVLANFGDALMAGKRPSFENTSMEESRYHVIPTSIDPNAPTELVPIQAQIGVDECITAASVKVDQGTHEQIYLRFKKGKETLFSSTWSSKAKTYEISPSAAWSAPDIAVLFFSTDDNTVMREKLRLANEFMNRHNVPVLMLSDEPVWGSTIEFPSMAPRSLKFCVESKNSILQSLPVDLETFENISSAQLNKHLAFLLQSRENTMAKPDIAVESKVGSIPTYFKDIKENMAKVFQQHNARRSIFLALRISTPLILMLITSALAYGVLWSTTTSPTAVQPLFPNHLTTSLTHAPVVVSSPSPISSETLPVSTATSETSLSPVATDLDIFRSVVVPAAEKISNSDTFDIKTLGSSHLILKAPRKVLTKRGRVPKFTVSVQRGEQELESQLDKVFDTVFTVMLNREDAYGKLNILIKMEKPTFVETHEVDFGKPWLKMKNWRRTVEDIEQIVLRKFSPTAEDAGQISSGAFDWHIQMLPEVALKHATEQLELVQKKASESLQLTANVVQTRSKQLQAELPERSKAVAKLVVSELNTAMHTLSEYSQSTTETGLQVFSNLWGSAVSSVARLGLSSPSKYVPSISEESLRNAQTRARYIMEQAVSARKRDGSSKGGQVKAKKAKHHNTKAHVAKKGKA